jgi:hypothetical protein
MGMCSCFVLLIPENRKRVKRCMLSFSCRLRVA